MRIVPVTLPSSDATLAALSLAQAKAHLRVDHDDDDTLIQDLLFAAFDFADRSGRGFAARQQTWDYVVSGWPGGGFRLPVWPVVSIGSITYLDHAGASQTLSADLYRLVGGGYPAAIVPVLNAHWPAVLDGEGTVTVRATIGHASAGTIPTDYLRAVLLLMAHWYRTPEAVTRNDQAEVPMGCRAIFDRYAAGLIA